MLFRSNEVADVVIVKVAPLGGVQRALKVISQLDKPVVISSALESSVGMAAGIALAAHLPEEITCGLGTVALLDGDVVSDSLLPQNGSVRVSEVEVRSELIEKYRVPQENEEKWHNRISRAYQQMVVNEEREARS